MVVSERDVLTVIVVLCWAGLSLKATLTHCRDQMGKSRSRWSSRAAVYKWTAAGRRLAHDVIRHSLVNYNNVWWFFSWDLNSFGSVMYAECRCDSVWYIIYYQKYSKKINIVKYYLHYYDIMTCYMVLPWYRSKKTKTKKHFKQFCNCFVLFTAI